MSNKISKILVAIFLSVITFHLYADKNWQPMNPEKISEAKVVASANEIEIRTQNGAIIVSTNTPTQIKVFTILGQLISQENLPAGVSRLEIGTHGVFIVKVEGLTCKVAL